MSNVNVSLKFKTTAVGIIVEGKFTYGEWETALSVTAGIVKSAPFWLGDLLNIGHSKFGEKYTQAINELGFDPGYLRNVSWVCSRVKLSSRNDKLFFSHHAAVAPCDVKDQEKWLALAVTNKWTVQQLREAMQKDSGEDSGDVEAPEGDDELSELVAEIETYLDGLEDNGARAAAIRTMFRTLKNLAQKYKGGSHE